MKMLNKKANLTLRLTGVRIFWSYTFPAMLVIVKIYKKYESLANLQMTAITKIQIFSETIFLVITSYGNAGNAYRDERKANVRITLWSTVYLNSISIIIFVSIVELINHLKESDLCKIMWIIYTFVEVRCTGKQNCIFSFLRRPRAD